MLIKSLEERFRAAPAYRALRRQWIHGERLLRATNLAGSSKPVLVAALAADLDVPVLVVAMDADRGETWAADLEALVGEHSIGYYPQWEILPYETRAPQREIEGRRLEFLAGLLDGSVAVGVTTVRAVMQRVAPPRALERHLLRLELGDRIDLEHFSRRLVDMGFDREAMVSEVGMFSVRGGIVDVFGYGHDAPIRLELVGDTLESVRTFDLATQRSVETLERIEILPAREARASVVDVEEGAGDDGERGHLQPLTAYLHPDCLVVVDEPDRIARAWEEAWEEAAARYSSVVADRDVPAPESLYLSPSIGRQALASFARLELEALHMTDPDSTGRVVRFSTRDPEPVRRSMKQLAEVLRHDRGAGLEPIILCDNLGQLERLEELLPRDLADVTLAVGALEGGFRLTDGGLAVYTDHEIFDRRRRIRARRRYARASAGVHLTQISAGDYLVHLDYGIGRYAGLERLHLGAGEVEVVKLVYADDEVLYVPVEQLGQIEKFTSEDGHAPAIHRLGSSRWERQKERTRQAIVEFAEELLRLHAEREMAEGFAFSPDTDWQRGMESSFLYEDTPDQRAATEAVKRDMERPRPMDRLVCGDVGYGKTEVAIRAVFKAVQDSRQAAVLVPTTVLAVQHLETFRERLADFPVRIEMLSRFNSPAQVRVVQKGLADGTVDVVIGTHRLLSDDIVYHDLGLVVVDEEQRFGVRHKDRLRTLKTSIDVLTLSATPIPRTMQMSLMGLREMSLIETPPRDRTPIVTWVTEFDEELVEEAIRREVDRGGQVFFVHNRVQTIDTMRRVIERLVPDLRVAVSHGQMRERDLEAVMVQLFHREIDVLVTSAIIESGLDVPSANTILINRADRFGLAELYQLRGRVGRSHHRAYCYLLTPPRDAMTKDAEKRLRVVEEHTDLGAGYAIALRDLELRGAGNLLGAEQSGFIATVGFETYLRLLEQTVSELKGESAHATARAELAYDADAYLPDQYIPDSQQKLSLYRRLGRLRESAEIEDFAAELVDRYGPLPTSARHLCDAARLRSLATGAGLHRLRVRPHAGVAELRWPAGVEPRLKSIQQAVGETTRFEVVRMDPLHLRLTAVDEKTLLRTLEQGLQAWAENSIVRV